LPNAAAAAATTTKTTTTTTTAAAAAAAAAYKQRHLANRNEMRVYGSMTATKYERCYCACCIYS